MPISYGEQRVYITPQDHPLGTHLKGVIIAVEKKTNTSGKASEFYRVVIEEHETGLFGTMILGDRLTPKNLHGKVVIALFGREVFDEQTYTDPMTLLDKEIEVTITGWKSKLDSDGKQVSYADLDIPIPEPSRRTRIETPKTEVSPPKVIDTPNQCDQCDRPLPKDETMILHHLDDDSTEYSFCSAKCKKTFLS
jgi:hypothetical protein